MNILRENPYGGLDIFSQQGEFLAHLGKDDVMKIYDIQQKNYDLDTVKCRIPDWVVEQHEQDDNFLADFNSHLFSDDEISTDEIQDKILGNDALIQQIAAAYRDAYDGELDWWSALNNAIVEHVSIKDVLGDILCDKYPKEFLIGNWRAVIVERGGTYGHNGELRNGSKESMVAFYDMSQADDSVPGGVYTGGCYSLTSLLEPASHHFTIDERVERGDAWNLRPPGNEYVLSVGNLSVLGAWLRSVYNRESVEMEAPKTFCRGHVMMPADVERLATVLNSNSPVQFFQNMIKSRLVAVPAFYDVHVEQVDLYDKKVGFEFAFTADIPSSVAGEQLQTTLKGLQFEAYSDVRHTSIDDKLSDAAIRSQLLDDGAHSGRAEMEKG